ncbi:MAG: DUF2254 family protein [Planctomycetota bacterium]
MSTARGEGTSASAAGWLALCVVLLGALALDLVPLLPGILRGSPANASELVTNCVRFLGVALSMLVALCALAVPLTANVYTPKLIELFVADRWNRAVISYFVVANVVALWNSYLVTVAPEDVAVRPRALFCLALTIGGMLTIGPYLLYVLRFLVPRSIVTRIQQEVVASLDGLDAESEDAEHDAGIARAVTNIQYLGKVTLRSIQRHDRDVAAEGLRALEEVFHAYQARKPYLPARALRPHCRDALGLSPELALEIERKQAVIEVAILQELGLLLPVAISTDVGEVISQLAALTRHLGVRVAERGDDGAAEMVLLHFNTFIREALREHSADAFYKLVYQYRRLAQEVAERRPQLTLKVAFFLDYYAHQAVKMRLPYLVNVVAYDLAALCEDAFRREAPQRERLLEQFVALDRDDPEIVSMPGVVKAQIILAAKLATIGVAEAAARLERELGKVPAPVLRETFAAIVAARDEHFWEIADRRRHLDHVEPEYREAVSALRGRLTGEQVPGRATARFLGAAAAPALRAVEPVAEAALREAPLAAPPAAEDPLAAETPPAAEEPSAVEIPPAEAPPPRGAPAARPEGQTGAE